MGRVIGLCALALLAACAPATAPVVPVVPVGPAVPVAAEDTCGAAPYARLIGQDATALERELIMRQIRVLRPGMLASADLRPARINFDIAPEGRIARVWCG